MLAKVVSDEPSPAACPKCGDTRPTPRAACTRCGLRVDRWATYDDAPAPHGELDVAFAALSEHWAERPAHDAFLGLARSFGALDAAVARYRRVLRARPDDADARYAVEQAVLLATHAHAAAPSEMARLFRGIHILGVVVGVALATSVAVLLAHVLRR